MENIYLTDRNENIMEFEISILIIGLFCIFVTRCPRKNDFVAKKNLQDIHFKIGTRFLTSCLLSWWMYKWIYNNNNSKKSKLIYMFDQNQVESKVSI